MNNPSLNNSSLNNASLNDRSLNTASTPHPRDKSPPDTSSGETPIAAGLGPSLMGARILVVDDQKSLGELIGEILRMRGAAVQLATDFDSAIGAVSRADFDAVLTDVRMPGRGGIDLCREVLQRRPQLPVLVMTAFGSMETAIEALRAGAYDFVVKPFENEFLLAALGRAVAHSRLQNQVRLLQSVASTQLDTPLLGQSPVMQRVLQQLGPISLSDASVLINGESGTGKELVARTIHQNSRRREGPFVALNCAAVSESLLESELFGHVKGSFTDANENRPGLFQSANGGTLLLDEMGDMPAALQVKLLRALEDGKVRPVGANHEIETDVRVLAATHRDLEAAVEADRFRADLFYRINVINVELPPLRERGTDILVLAEHFIRMFSEKSGRRIEGLTRPAAEKLLGFSWPGNIRELRNVIERGVALSTTDHFGVEDLPAKVLEHEVDEFRIGGDDVESMVPLETIEDRYIKHVLKATGGNKTWAAEVLGLDRKTLYRKLKEDKPHDATLNQR